MTVNMNIKKVLAAFAIAISLTAFSPAEAAVETISGSGEYTLGPNDSIQKAKDGALVEAMRSCAEKAGVFVQSYTQTQQMQVTQDQVIAATGSVLKVLQKHYETTTSDIGDVHILCVIQAEVDTDRALEALKIAMTVKPASNTGITIARHEPEAQSNEAKTSQEKDDRDSATGYLIEGENQINLQNYDSAADLIRQAIAFAPHWGRCYEDKGELMFRLKRDDAALDAFKRGMELDPTWPSNYVMVADSIIENIDNTPAYDKIRLLKKAIDLLDKASQMDLLNTNWRGLVEEDIGAAYYNLAHVNKTRKEAPELDKLRLSKQHYVQAAYLYDTHQSTMVNRSYISSQLDRINNVFTQNIQDF